jgi:ATP-dependent Clp protease ATP-binding subunit ClpX
VLITLSSLDEDTLVSILTQPKNAIIKQYQYLFEIDDVHLEFQEDALRAMARLAIERETGARGLRAIVEGLLTQVMYDVPSDTTIEKCIITKDVVDKTNPPQLTHNENRQPIVRKTKRRRTRSRATAG